MSQFQKVKEFHEKFEVMINEDTVLPDEETRKLRRRLLKEEYEEYLEAEEENDVAEIARELADILYIVNGTAVSYGIPLDQVFDHIHNCNMSKLGEDGKPVRREDGKVLKGPNFVAPNVKKILKTKF